MKSFFLFCSLFLTNCEAGRPVPQSLASPVHRKTRRGVWQSVAKKSKRLRAPADKTRTRRSAAVRRQGEPGRGGGGGDLSGAYGPVVIFPPQPVTLFSVAWSRVQAAAPQRDIQSGTQRGSRQPGPNDEETRFVASSNKSLPPERRRLRRVSP